MGHVAAEDSVPAITPAEVIRQRLRDLRGPTRALLDGKPSLEPEELPVDQPWHTEPVECEVLDGGPLNPLVGIYTTTGSRLPGG